MHPELFKIGPFAVHSYGVMLALSFILGIFISVRNAERRQIKGELVVNLGFLIIISSIVGSRLAYVLFHLEEFQGRWHYTFWPVQENGTVGLGGLILLGGVILSFLTGIVYLRYKKLDFWEIGDSVAPAIGLGIFLTRIGCYLNGCCFGKVCSSPFGVVFPPDSPAGAVMGDAHIHPTQLYSAFYGLIIFAILMVLERKNYFNGLVLGSFLILYGVARFIIDFYRYYETQMFIIGNLNFNQVVSIVMFLAGIGVVIYRYRHSRQALGRVKQ